MTEVAMDRFELWQAYERGEIAARLGYGEAATWRGVFTPKGAKTIILFVTREKQTSQTQYRDGIYGPLLFWEGEAKHGNDRRVANATVNRDEIHLFFRTRHHQPFIYFGQVHVRLFDLREATPSHFVFDVDALVRDDVGRDQEAGVREPDPPEYRVEPVNTERVGNVKQRRGQDEFRRNVINLWQSCSVTSLQRHKLLRASHIKPWRHCVDSERLDAFNGLLLTPNLDLLFDTGLVTFSRDTGHIVISDELTARERRILRVGNALSLRTVYPANRQFLEYHGDCVYESWRRLSDFALG